MKRRLVSLAVLGSSLGFAAPVFAQNLSDQGTFIVAGDRLVGFVHTAQTIDVDSAQFDETTTINDFSLLAKGDVVSPFSNPRVSFDYFIIDGLSLGGSLAFWTQSGEVEDQQGNQNDIPDQSGFILAPRVGYLALFSESVGIWPRGGFTFYSLSTDLNVGGNDEQTTTGLGFNIDVPFVFIPAEHAAILVGPGLDFSPIGGGEFDAAGPFGNVEYDYRIFDFGLYAGLGIWF